MKWSMGRVGRSMGCKGGAWTSGKLRGIAGRASRLGQSVGSAVVQRWHTHGANDVVGPWSIDSRRSAWGHLKTGAHGWTKGRVHLTSTFTILKAGKSAKTNGVCGGTGTAVKEWFWGNTAGRGTGFWEGEIGWVRPIVGTRVNLRRSDRIILWHGMADCGPRKIGKAIPFVGFRRGQEGSGTGFAFEAICMLICIR